MPLKQPSNCCQDPISIGGIHPSQLSSTESKQEGSVSDRALVNVFGLFCDFLTLFHHLPEGKPAGLRMETSRVVNGQRVLDPHYAR